MKFPFNTFSSPVGGAIYLYLCGLLSILPQISAARFDADAFFTYIDQSCKDSLQGTVKAEINVAGDDMNLLVSSVMSEGFNFDSDDEEGGRAGRAFKAFWGKLDGAPSVTDPANTKGIRDNFEQLGENMAPKSYGIYCDASAFEYITIWPEDTPEGDDWGIPGETIEGGAWYIRDATRRVPDGAYLASSAPVKYPAQLGDDLCTPKDENGNYKGIAGASLPAENYIVMCPSAFSQEIGDQLATFGETRLPDGEDLDWFASAGATMLHEFTHAVFSTFDPAYGAEACIDLVTEKTPGDARENADSWMFFALASYLNKNEWIHDGVSSPLQAAVRPAVVARCLGCRIARNNGQKIKRRYLYANETASSSLISSNSTMSSKTASSSLILPNSTVSPTEYSVVSTSSLSSSSSITTSSSLNSTKIATVTLITTSPSISNSSTTEIDSSSSNTGSSTSSSSPTPSSSSSVVPTSTDETGFSSSSFSSGFTTSLLSSSSKPFTWSGSWSDTTTQTPVSLSFFDLPTGTIAPSEQTSDAVLLKSLFFALKNNREWLTDPKLKSQYIDNVKHVKDQILTLFNKLEVNIPEPDCSTTKRKRGENTMSERQLRDFLVARALLQDRSILSGVANAIKGAIHDVTKLLSCAINVVDNLVDSVIKDTPNVDLIQDLTDSLAAVGDALGEPEDEPTKTNPTSTEASRTTSTENSSSSYSSSSSSTCSMSTAIPICTEMVILSTSYLPGRSTFTVDSTTTTTCLTSTINACSGSGSTLTTTASGSKITGYTFKTFYMDPANTAPQFVDASKLMSLSSILAIKTVASGTSILASLSSPTSSSLNSTASSSAFSNTPTSFSSPPSSSLSTSTGLPSSSPSSSSSSSSLPSSSLPSSSLPSSSLPSSSLPSSSLPTSAIISSTSTTAPSPTSTSFWELTLYNTTCKDHATTDLGYSYYTLTGSEVAGSRSCFPLQKLPQNSLNSCLWFTDAGINPAQPCSAGTFQYPTSYIIRNGLCAVYSNDDCTGGNNLSIMASDPLSCSDTTLMDGLPTTWLSFSCAVIH